MAQENSISDKIKNSIINYLCGNWDACDSPGLNAWLEESNSNKQLFGQLVNLWEADQMIRRERHFDPDQAWARLVSRMDRKTPGPNRLIVFKRALRYAAIVLMALLAGGGGHYLIENLSVDRSASLAVAEYHVPYGSKTSLKLPDGTLVWINAGTTLKYDRNYGTGNRNIALSGEAYFDVSKNEKLPFIVTAKGVSVRALGTKFNVKAYYEEKTIETILLEGLVKVQKQVGGNQKDVLLDPGQKAIFHTNLDEFTVSVISDKEEVSWFTNEWVIKNTSLEAFAKLLERRYKIHFRYDDERVRNYEFGGTIKDETIEQILTAMTYSAPLKYKITDNEVTLSIDESKLNKYRMLLE